MLTHVTISGADDAVDPRDLADLSHEFAFVEWGILFSEKRAGEPRYPTASWVSRLPIIARASIHMCGSSARGMLLGSGRWLSEAARHFYRVQVNGYAPPAALAFRDLVRQWVAFDTFILQARDEAAVRLAEEDVLMMGRRRAAILFDPSAGGGIAPNAWPASTKGIRMGFAGGITPENVESVLTAIGPRPGHHYWIDMESGVRTDDRFDLGLVADVLAKCAPFVRPI